MRRHPHLYELNARVFLRRLSEKYGRELTLATIPDEVWRRFARQGFDLLWLMGVWRRSPAARLEALRHPALRRQYDAVLPGWTEADIDGSPYAVHAYELDAALGKDEELGEVKSRLNRLGLGLVLDFVPNHLARDHPWTRSSPERFVRGSEADARAHTGWFFKQGGLYLAHGRDPYFPPWTDTVQVNFFSAGLREALIGELENVAEVADGVRCDMAMLALNDVFEQIWGKLAGCARPRTEFWAEAISRVKARRPDFLFIAEVYWGLEARLQRLGFDYVYDKVLYDKLRFCPADEIRSHIADERLCPPALVRFIENHDEARAAAAFGGERSRAAAVVVATLPGLSFFHDGQFEGKRLRIPVQLVREPEETPDPGLMKFYDRLLAVVNQAAFHEGEWRLLDARSAWTGNKSHRNLLAWMWHYRGAIKIVAANYSASAAQGRLRLPLEFARSEIIFEDELSGAAYTSRADEVHSQGLYVALEPWRSHILSVVAAPLGITVA